MKKSINGASIRELRTMLGMTQQEFGRLLRVGGTSVSKWERDKAAVSLHRRDVLTILMSTVRHKSAQTLREVRQLVQLDNEESAADALVILLRRY